MSTQPTAYLTEEQYLEIERKAEYKSEYINGQMFAMAGASLVHVRINSNVVLALGPRLAGSGCTVLFNDLRLRVPATRLYAYPDILVICGKPELADEHMDIVINPTVIVEILSPTTETYDRGNKFVHYRSIPSLQDYLIVSQDQIQAEHCVRQPDGGWLLHVFSGPDAVIALDSIGVRFNLAEAYDGVEL